jgi:hypothetical protein
MEMGKVKIFLLALLVMVFAASATPAEATYQSSSCTVYATTCSSGAVHTSSYHQVGYTVLNAYYCSSHFDVYDSTNGVSVRSGNVGTGHSTSGIISGLYATYYIRVKNTCYGTNAQIDSLN